MLYNKACGEELSRLGFGCMRLRGRVPAEHRHPGGHGGAGGNDREDAELGGDVPPTGRSSPEAEGTESVKQLLYDRYRRENTWNSRETNR